MSSLFCIKAISDTKPRTTNAKAIETWLNSNHWLLASSQTIIEMIKIPIVLENMNPLSGNDLNIQKVIGKASNIYPSIRMTQVITWYLLVQTPLLNISEYDPPSSCVLRSP